MSLYVLDTDTVSLYQHDPPVVTAAVDARPSSEKAVTIISVEEQFAGWCALLRRAQHPPQLAHVYQRFTQGVQMLSRLSLLTFTEPAIARYDQLLGLRLNVGKNDLRIAAITLENHGILVTRNLRDFQRVPNLTVENWAA